MTMEGDLQELRDALDSREWENPSSWQIWTREGRDVGFEDYTTFRDDALETLEQEGVIDQTGYNAVGRKTYEI